jgi:hypothetical protein
MNKSLLIFGVFSLVCSFQPLFATSYYVDGANGHNSNLGLSATSAFQTIAKASSVMNAGDTCYICTGNYYTGTTNIIEPVNSGSAGMPITYTNYAGDRVNLMGGNNIYHDSVGDRVAGPYIDDSCSNMTVANNLVYNMDLGMVLNLPDNNLSAYNNTLASTSGTSIISSGTG